MKRTVTVMLALLLGVAALADAGVPPMISYQGKLMQPSGAPVPDGTYSIRFAIYDAPTGGNTLWSEVNPSVQVKGGLFATMLGSVVNLPANIFDGSSRFFGVKVGGDPEMTPRQQVASVAFAVKAASADTATTVPAGAITTSKLANGAVTAPTIGDKAVTAEKIADSAIVTTSMANNSVTEIKLSDGAITAPKIAAGAITAAKIEPQQAWLSAVLGQNWVNAGTIYATACYMKDSLGFVHLRGVIKDGIIGNVAFILPVGYRPASTAMIGTVASSAFGLLVIDASGNVTPATGNNTYFSLDNITFRAEH